ncbi:MAG: hypothetical protein ACI841_003184 [Planctomycetota bacterium]|jgi:hypothetical protein
MLNNKYLRTILLAAAALSACTCVPKQSSDKGIWTEFEVIEASEDERPDWLNAGLVGYGESTYKMDKAREEALTDIIVKAAKGKNVEVDYEMIRTQTDSFDYARANSKLTVSETISVQYTGFYWEKTLARGKQFGCPAESMVYRAYVGGK